MDDEDDDADSVTSSTAGGGPDFNYILSMALWCLTKEKKEALLKDRDEKAEKLYQLKRKSSKDLWRDDLKEFMEKLNVRKLLFSCFEVCTKGWFVHSRQLHTARVIRFSSLSTSQFFMVSSQFAYLCISLKFFMFNDPRANSHHIEVTG